MTKILAVSFLLMLSGCVAAPLVITGVGVASVASNETTGKSITDHAVSTVKNQDCKIARAFNDKPVCQDPVLNQIQITNTVAKPSSVAEIESRYRQ
jgi:starvation-inducible outer membrane lipoprotein